MIRIGIQTEISTGNLSVLPRAAEKSLEAAGITCNKNGIPFDPEKPTVTSGIRLGTPAATTRGFGIAEFQELGIMILKVLDGLAELPDGDSSVESVVNSKVLALCERFPVYSDLGWWRQGSAT